MPTFSTLKAREVESMRTLNKEQADPLVAAICRGQLWATPEETAAWLKTETGQRIAALIERERKRAAA